MQPPPRKGNHSKFLKSLHSEQVAKLQLKNQHECELLEDIRQFTIKRSAIEKSYSESLLKISSVYLNKKMVCIPEIKLDGTEKWNMWSVWQTVLEENEKLAKARLAAIEVFQQQIADEAKSLRDYKIQISKKCLNQLANIQKEVQTTVQKIDITKKSYFDEEHSAHGVRDKARDIEEKLKKKKGSFFQSITSLQKNSARVTSRKEELEEKSTGARNDYLLSLAQANAHQNRYFTVDLQTSMTTMENYVFERIADYLTLMGRTELLTCSATQHSFTKIRDQANQLTREYNVQCLYLLYPVLKQHIQYDYEPCDNDQVTKITAEHDSAAATLSREAKMFAARIVRENNSIRENARKLAVCQQLRDSGQRSDPNDPNGPDLETKIEEFREKIRKSETEKAKAESSLECLRAGGVNVDEWMQEAETLGVQELPRSSSSLSMRTDASGHGEHQSSDSFYDSDNTEAEAAPVAKTSQPSAPAEIHDDDDSSIADSESQEEADIPAEQPRVEEFTANWDDPTAVDWGTEDTGKVETAQPVVNQTSTTTSAPTTTEQIFKCTALYSYNAQNPDELTIVENEQLEVIGDGDGDGWLRARNYRGEEGYVPHNYLDVERDVATDTNANQALTTQISFSSVDYTVESEEQDMQSPDQVSVIAVPVSKPKSDKEYCIALYDYDASAEDELTFEENQIITIINKSPHGVDDGWWEGEIDGKFGNFPSLVVEECDELGEPLTEPELDSPEPASPPVFNAPLPPAPPEYYKDLEDAVNEANLLNGSDSEQQTPSKPSVKFEMELSEDRQNLYGKQSSKPTPVMVLEPYSDEEEEDGEEGEKVEKKPSKPKAKKEVKVDEHPTDLGLGFVQISVTAATPMVEDADKSFLDDIIKEEEEHELEQERQSEQQLKRSAELEQEVAEAVDEILEEARIETSKRPQQAPPLPPDEPKHSKPLKKTDSKDEQKHSRALKKTDSEEHKKPLRKTDSKDGQSKPLRKTDSREEQSKPIRRTDSREEKPLRRTDSREEQSRSMKRTDSKDEAAKRPTVVKPQKESKSREHTKPPSAPPPPPPPAAAQQSFEDKFGDSFANFEANFEANFDDAFGSSQPEPEMPKQMGGRASIPDELDSQQLERLQNLKESNA